MLKNISMEVLFKPLRQFKKLHLAEVLGLLIIIPMVLISLWRAFYMPVTTYDSIHGIDLMAQSAIADGKIDSRMYEDLGDVLSTQPYYAPFTALSQIIYRLAGFPFGKVWISLLFASLLLTFYLNLRRKLHPAIAVFLTSLLIIIPEMFGYTFLLQTDYSNAVFLSLAVIYLARYLDENNDGLFWLSGLFAAFACWTRSETIVFVVMTLGLFALLKYSGGLRSIAGKLAGYFAMSLIAFGIWNLFYLPFVLDYSPESYFAFGFWDLERLQVLINGMWFVTLDTNRWSYVLLLFLGGAVINLLYFKDKKNVFVLLWVIMFIVTFLVLLYHLQLSLQANINYTYRRGLFKLWPVAVYYLGSSAMLIRLSAQIKKWENAS